MAGCTAVSVQPQLPPEGAANHAQQLIDGFRTNHAFLETPPLGGAKVAYAYDYGSNSAITGRDPGVLTVFATTQSVRNLVQYYEATYPELHFSADCCATTASASVLGRKGFTNFVVDISALKPYLPAHYAVTLSGVQPPNPMYVTVVISGQPRGN